MQEVFRHHLTELPADSPGTAVREVALRKTVHEVLNRPLRHVVLNWNLCKEPGSWDIEVDAGCDGVHQLHVKPDYWIGRE